MKHLRSATVLLILSGVVFGTALTARQNPSDQARRASGQLTLSIDPVARPMLTLLPTGTGGSGAQTRDEAVRAMIRAIEAAAQQPLEVVATQFEERIWSEDYARSMSAAERAQLLSRVQQAVRSVAGVRVNLVDGKYIMNLDGMRPTTITFTVTNQAPFRMTSMTIAAPEQQNPADTLTADTLERAFDKYAELGLSGNVYVRVAGKELLKKSYGMAHKGLGIPIRIDSIFGIGSMPIAFTIASIYLLEQQGTISQNDVISKYLSDVPPDKRQMTLRHLMTGASGLPDFHDRPGDWDADLAWIDRDEAVSRILAQPLLFEPGASNRHSHSAFGLLAAIVEIVSGDSYAQFLEKHFFRPAGMTRTGMYGEARNFGITDFAEGNGRSSVGVPNIPPNWGPTSWLVMGSGGMYSTLDDLLRFQEFVSSGTLLTQQYAAYFNRASTSVNGSVRGFFLFTVRNAKGDIGVMLLNVPGREGTQRDAVSALGEFIRTR